MKKKLNTSQSFDRGAFFLGIGMGIVFIGIGLFLIWAISSAPEGISKSSGFTLAQRLARTLPATIQERLALGLAWLFVLFGIFCTGLGLNVVTKYLVLKLKK